MIKDNKKLIYALVLFTIAITITSCIATKEIQSRKINNKVTAFADGELENPSELVFVDRQEIINDSLQEFLDEIKEEEGQKLAYLTFDDGPNEHTNKILDILKDKSVKATFFVLGPHAKENGDIIKRIKKEGHALGVHGMTHNFKYVYASPEAFLNEMDENNNILQEIIGEKTLLLRAPYGSKPYMKQDFRDLIISKRYRIWDWNIDSMDSIKQHTTSEEVYSQVVRQLVNKERAIILFHDKEHTANALERIIDHIQLQEFEMRKLNESMTPLNFWGDTR